MGDHLFIYPSVYFVAIEIKISAVVSGFISGVLLTDTGVFVQFERTYWLLSLTFN